MRDHQLIGKLLTGSIVALATALVTVAPLLLRLRCL